MDILTIIKYAIAHSASDLHCCVGTAPHIRLQGTLIPLGEKKLQANDFQSILETLKIPSKMNEQDIDGACEHPLLNQRFRFNVYQQIQGPALALRLIPHQIPTLESLQLPLQINKFCELSQGLVLVTGSTGSGKSTTLAAMIQHINHTQKKHIITIEDPIEFIHSQAQCLINQREIKKHTPNFSTALRAALRQDPDIILIGEIRELETIRLALQAAETGHLVLATLHTQSAPQTIDRIINIFPGDEQNTIRSALAQCLQGIITQELINTPDGKRQADMEILISTHAIRNMIRENKTAQILSAMQTGAGVGMQVRVSSSLAPSLRGA